MDDRPLSPGERWMLGDMLSSFIQARESGDDGRADRLERKVAWILGRFYKGRRFAFCGLLFSVDESTPRDCVLVTQAESLD